MMPMAPLLQLFRLWLCAVLVVSDPLRWGCPCMALATPRDQAYEKWRLAIFRCLQEGGDGWRWRVGSEPNAGGERLSRGGGTCPQLF